MSGQTAERVSATDMSDNYVFQRSLLAYLEAAEMVSGDVLEIGAGMGYGIKHIAPKAENYMTIDKFPVDIDPKWTNVSFQQMEIGKFIVTTPNKKMSITRNPWHIREYTIQELKDLLGKYFSKVDAKGVFGNKKIMDYYEKNKASVHKITRFDIFNLQYRLPRQVLQIPYDILNRRNRKKLLKENTGLVSDIHYKDYNISEAKEGCFDLLYVATK